MDLGKLHNKLVAAARTIAPDERVPYAFEKRVMALLPVAPGVLDRWEIWSRAMWKAAATCVAVMTLCGAWAVLSQRARPQADFSQQFETAVLASASADESW